MSKSDEEIVSRAIEDAVPDQWNYIGKSNQRDVVRFTLKGVSPEKIVAPTDAEGHHTQMVDVVQVVAYTAIAAKNILDIYLSLRQSNAEVPPPEEIAKQAKVHESLPPDAGKKVAESVWKQLTLF